MLLAYRPFLDPLVLGNGWVFLLIPLCFGIAVAYKGVRAASMSRFWRETLSMTVQLVLGIVLFGAVTFAVVQYVVPAVAPGGR